MYQSFEVTSAPERSRERVGALRASFDAWEIDGFVVPHADEHASEYPPRSAARLEWLSGFTGSAGFAVVAREGAHIFSDGRYTLQLGRQTDGDVWTRHDSTKTKLPEFLAGLGSIRLGIDPWLHTIAGARRLTAAVEKAGGSLVRLPRNPVDAVWPDRPAKPRGPVTIHRNEYAGRLAKDKLREMGEALREAGARSHVVTDPLSLAWMFNLRGTDVEHNPVPLGWAILHADRRPAVLIEEDRLGLSARAYLRQLSDLGEDADLSRAVAAAAVEGPVMLDPERAADALRGIVEWAGGTVVEAPDPAILPRAVKNETEIAGARAAHRRDGAAMVGFLHWLSAREAGTVTEIEAAQTLERTRATIGERLGEPLRDIAFDTISGSGPNGAIVHYRVTTDSDRALEAGELYLCDSGGQYHDGTTDVTRTVAISEPTAEMRERFTLVLKGMIAISRLRFPEAIEGRHIDAIAREALWRHGLDYGHGTGHGVGSYGAVHEGPQGISRRSTTPFRPGMIVSNEPGYYKADEYGIRTENLLLVREAEEIEGGDAPMLGFETLTLVPIDRALIDLELLDGDEIGWVDRYHARVCEVIEPLLDDQAARAWLRRACEPLQADERAAPSDTVPPVARDPVDDITAEGGHVPNGAAMVAGVAPDPEPSDARLAEGPERDDQRRADGDDGDQPEAQPDQPGDGERQGLAPADQEERRE